MRLGYVFAVLTFVLPVQASELYTFTYTRTSGLIQSFSFSVTSPGFITGNTALPINGGSFNVTDGTNTFTLTQARADFNIFTSAECFTFGDAGVTLNTGCGPTVPPGGSDLLAAFSPAPSMTGVYPDNAVSPNFFQATFGANNPSVPTNGTFTLAITDVVSAGVPEPSSIFLTATGLAGLAWWMRKRAKAIRGSST